MDVDSQIELYDSEFLAIEQGPLAWANRRTGSRRNIDQFCRDMTEQFAMIGLVVDVQPWTTLDPDVYAFKLIIQGRTVAQRFDFERMQHEVRANILEIPGAGGVIKFDPEAFRREHGTHTRH